MLYKEIAKAEDCEICPAYEDICPGGWSCYGGAPIEPPCTCWDDDTDVTQWVEEQHARTARADAADDERIRRNARKQTSTTTQGGHYEPD